MLGSTLGMNMIQHMLKCDNGGKCYGTTLVFERFIKREGVRLGTNRLVSRSWHLLC